MVAHNSFRIMNTYEAKYGAAMKYQKYGLLVNVFLLIALAGCLHDPQPDKVQASSASADGAVTLQPSTQMDFSRQRFPANFGTLPEGKYGTLKSLSSQIVAVLESPRDLFQFDTRMTTIGTRGIISISNIEALKKTYEKLNWTLSIYRMDPALRQYIPDEPEWILVGKSEMGILEPELPIQIPKGGQFLIAMENVSFRLQDQRSESEITIPRFSLKYLPTDKSAPVN